MAHILVIDDTKNIRKMVTLALAQAGHSVESAENGAQGLQMFAQGADWDLTLVDQQMPEVQGDEFVIEARKRDPRARIVMMTAFATPQLAAEVIQSGALDFLRKPFTTDVLRGAVEVALSHSAHGASATTSPFDPHLELPKPGQPHYILPRVSWRINGFSFWPIDASQSGAHPSGFELGRLFQIHAPNDDYISCFVGVTPHVRAQIEGEIGHAVVDESPFWDKVCGQTMLIFLSERAQTPPDVLPVYEAPKLRGEPSGALTWGAFFGE